MSASRLFGTLGRRRSRGAEPSAHRSDADPAADARTEQAFAHDMFEILRRKWGEVPAGDRRLLTTEFEALADGDLLAQWLAIRDNATTGANFPVRGWYHALYSDVLSGKRVLDVGCGLGLDGVTFAEAGAQVTFVDIVETNLKIVRRVCGLLGVTTARFRYLWDLASLGDLPRDYDAVWCQGSMINAPFSAMREEAQALLQHLSVGGRWIELAYPRIRWEREGRLPFSQWAERTDGPGTPWVEWYDLPKLLRRLEPAEFETVLAFEFHGSDFNWFDLMRTR